MQQQKRRVILLSLSGMAATAAGIPLVVFAVAKIDPKDPQAVSLGYVEDSTKADKAKYPKHDNTQMCGNCQFYQAAQESGGVAPCAILGGKGVVTKGWCSAWMKKPA
jgi:hypothetical protein